MLGNNKKYMGSNNNVTCSGQIFAEAVGSGETNNNAIKSNFSTNSSNIGGHIYNNALPGKQQFLLLPSR